APLRGPQWRHGRTSLHGLSRPAQLDCRPYPARPSKSDRPAGRYRRLHLLPQSPAALRPRLRHRPPVLAARRLTQLLSERGSLTRSTSLSWRSAAVSQTSRSTSAAPRGSDGRGTSFSAPSRRPYLLFQRTPARPRCHIGRTLSRPKNVMSFITP